MSGLIFWGIIFSVRAHYLDILDLRFSLFILSVPSIHIVHSLFPERSRLGLRPQPMRSPQTRWSPKRVKRQPASQLRASKLQSNFLLFLPQESHLQRCSLYLLFCLEQTICVIFDASIDSLYGLFLPASFSVNLRWVALSFSTFTKFPFRLPSTTRPPSSPTLPHFFKDLNYSFASS